jgi:uncharacterized protein YecE (DUF72 family)
MSSRFWLGCAVWAYRDWVGDFYPAGTCSSDYLSCYSQRLTAVEGNTTFYSVPDATTVQRWHNETPASFRFCLKLPRAISHAGLLQSHQATALAFIERMQPLGDRLGPMFLQLPPGYGPKSFADLEAFLNGWPAEVPLAVEPRHPAWFAEPAGDRLDALLQEYRVARVLLDSRPVYSGSDDPQARFQIRKPQLPLRPVLTAPFTLVRLISHPDRPRNRPYLQFWVEQVQQWLSQDINLFFFVHCPEDRFSPGTALQFQELLQAAGAPIPTLPWQQLAPEPSQLSLF